MPANTVTNGEMFLAQMSSGVTHMITKIGIFMIVGLVIGALVTIPLKGWMLSKRMPEGLAGFISKTVLTIIVGTALFLCMLSFAKAPPSP